MKDNAIEIIDSPLSFTDHNKPGDITFYTGANIERLRICGDGSILWEGRKVETDDDLRAAMRSLSQYMLGMTATKES